MMQALEEDGCEAELSFATSRGVRRDDLDATVHPLAIRLRADPIELREGQMDDASIASWHGLECDHFADLDRALGLAFSEVRKTLVVPLTVVS